MPEFHTSAYINLEPSEFIEGCSKREIRDLIECLGEYGHLPSNLADDEWTKLVLKLAGPGKMQLTVQEEDAIMEIANKVVA